MSYSDIATRTTSDANSAADINQLMENIREIGGNGTSQPDSDIQSIQSHAYINGVLRNAIINGRGLVSQRASSHSYADGDDGYKCVDRWPLYIGSSSAVINMSKVTNGGIRLECTTADTSVDSTHYIQLSQKIEGYNFVPFVGKTALMSFKIKSNMTDATFCIFLKNNGNDRTYIKEFTITGDGNWETVSMIVPFDYSGGTWNYGSGVGLRVGFTFMTGSTYQSSPDSWLSGSYLGTSNCDNFANTVGNYVELDEIQLHEGNIYLPYPHENIGDTLAKCYRYFWKGQATGKARASFYFGSAFGYASGPFVQFLVPMRTVPTVAIVTAPIYQNCSHTDFNVSTEGLIHRVAVTAAGNYRAYDGWYSADAEL